MLRAAAATQNPNSTHLTTIKIVRDALAEQEARFRDIMDAKDQMIGRQRDMLIDQRRQILEKERVNQDPDIIQITELQKVQEMDPKDKYRVLEFLVKELMNMRDEMPPEPQYPRHVQHQNYMPQSVETTPNIRGPKDNRRGTRKEQMIADEVPSGAKSERQEVTRKI